MDCVTTLSGDFQYYDHLFSTQNCHCSQSVIITSVHVSIQSSVTYPKVTKDFPAYSDTGYSDTPVRVTVLTDPKWPSIHQK